ncbi:MAG TPA: GNAT family N-acetyltransferase [Candidatus Nanopelagicales bacterium]
MAAPPGATPAPTPSRPSGHPRPAQPADVPEILRLIRELAAYERAAEQVVATEARITALLFGDAAEPGAPPAPAAFCHVIDAPTRAGSIQAAPRLAGFALWFRNASTWLGRHGVYLEDLYVSPEHRGRGYGRALMAALAALCVELGYGRLEWWVLDWNESAIDFYRSLGAQAMDEWTVHRLTGPALAALAASATPSEAAPAGTADAPARQGLATP